MYLFNYQLITVLDCVFQFWRTHQLKINWTKIGSKSNDWLHVHEPLFCSCKCLGL